MSSLRGYSIIGILSIFLIPQSRNPTIRNLRPRLDSPKMDKVRFEKNTKRGVYYGFAQSY